MEFPGRSTNMREWLAFQFGRVFLYFLRKTDPDMAYRLIKAQYETIVRVEDEAEQKKRYNEAMKDRFHTPGR
jgi:hypothetical protein